MRSAQVPRRGNEEPIVTTAPERARQNGLSGFQGAPGDLRLGRGRSLEPAYAVLAGSLRGGRHDRLLVTSAGQLGAAAHAPACLITVPPMC